MIRRNTWIMLVIFVGALGGVLFWSRRSQAESATPTPARPSLWSFDEGQIQGLRLEDLKAGKVVELRRDPDMAWRMVQPDEEPADAGRVERAVTWLRSPQVSRVLEGQQDLAPFGLADPGTRVTLLLDDGTERAFDVGSASGIAGKTYIRIAGSDAIQVVSGYGLDDVTGLLDDPPMLPTEAPEPTSEGGPAGTPTAAP